MTRAEKHYRNEPLSSLGVLCLKKDQGHSDLSNLPPAQTQVKKYASLLDCGEEMPIRQ